MEDDRKVKIAYQNKDITSKILAQEFRGKPLSAIGIPLPAVKYAEPTNLPAIEANELRIDDLFTLEDDSLAIIDYESRYSEENKCKYLNYISRVAKRIYREKGYFPTVRMVVIYTADVERSRTSAELDMGALKLSVTEAFLSDFKPDKLYRELKRALSEDRDLDDGILMKLIVYPLTYKDLRQKKAAVGKAIELAESIKDVDRQVFALTGIYTFADKIIRKEDAERIRRNINMTKVEQIYTAEREAAVEAAVEATRKEARKEAKKEAKRSTEEFARALLKEGDPVDKVARCLGLSTKKVEKLRMTI